MRSRTEALAIEVEALSRTYGAARRWRRKGEARVGLIDVNLTVPVGEVHGVLGPNGAGKTTLCKILTTLLTPTSGRVAVLGHDVVRDAAAVRRCVSLVLGGERGLYYRLTARENLRFWAALQGLPDRDGARRATTVLEQVGIAERADDLVQTLSRGMKQRLHLARGLISDPPVLILDEPTTGMDPIAMKEFRDLILRIAGDRTILLTTHDMAEAEQLCDRVTMIGSGRVIATESPRTLASWVTRFERIDIGAASAEIIEKVKALEGIGDVTANEVGDARVETVAEGATAAVLRLLADSGHTSVRVSMPSLEEVYVHLFGTKGAKV
jgi:ABC-2 type transport system ATP-binding protein